MRGQSVSLRLRKAGFADLPKVGRFLEECTRHGIDPPSVRTFAQTASPDQCLLLLTRLVEACSDKQTLSGLFAGLSRPRLLAVLGLSKALGDLLVTHPGVESFVGLDAAVSLGDFIEETEKRGVLAAVGVDRGRYLAADKVGVEPISALRRWCYG